MTPQILTLTTLLICGDGARILFHSMHASHSHMGSMLPVAKALLDAGHSVHFLETSDNHKAFNFPKGIETHFITVPTETDHKGAIYDVWTAGYSPERLSSVFSHGDLALQKLIRHRPREVEAVLNSTWDIIFADDLFSLTGYGLALTNARDNRKPFVMFSTTVLLQLHSWERALSRLFVLRPSFEFPVDDKASFDVRKFSHRLRTFFDEFVAFVTIKFTVENLYNKGLLMLGVRDFSFTDLWSNSACGFQEEINALAYPQPISNDVVQIGYHCSAHKDLSDELRRFVEDPASKGTIYVAFGTFARFADASQSHIDSFKRLLFELEDYRVLFVGDGEVFGKVPAHVKILNWAPQYDVLQHPKTRLFISHCGLKSFKEAICSRTPTICVPLFAEQAHNAAIGTKLGFVRSVRKLNMTPDKLLMVALDMLTDDSYAKAAEKACSFYADRPLSSEDEAVFWTGRLLRVGFRKPTFRRKGVNMSSFVYFYVPEALFLLFAIYVVTEFERSI